MSEGFFKFIFKIFSVCVPVGYANMCMYGCSQRPKEGFGSY